MILSLENLSLVLDDKSIFANLNLTLKQGEKIAIIAPNGSGKTSLLEIIAGLKTQNTGTIRLFDKNITSLDDYESIRDKIGFLFEDSNAQFICQNVLDDVAFSVLTNSINKNKTNFKILENLALKTASQTLELLEISHLQACSPFKLSNGQKRIVALAGVLAFNPALMLLDEPENALDTAFKQKIINILKNHKSAIIFSSHNLKFAKSIADKIYTLSQNGLEIFNE